jgi:hypothetical protein
MKELLSQQDIDDLLYGVENYKPDAFAVYGQWVFKGVVHYYVTLGHKEIMDWLIEDFEEGVDFCPTKSTYPSDLHVVVTEEVFLILKLRWL